MHTAIQPHDVASPPSPELMASLLRHVVARLDEGVAVFDAELRLVVWNETFVELLDYPSDLVQAGVALAALVRHDAARGVYQGGDVVQITSAQIRLACAGERYATFRRRADGGWLALGSRRLANGFLLQQCCPALVAPGTEAAAEALDPAAFMIAPCGPALADGDGRIVGRPLAVEQAVSGFDGARLGGEFQRPLLSAFEALPAGVAAFDGHDRLVFFNRRYGECHPEIADRLVPGLHYLDLKRLLIESKQFALNGRSPEEMLRWLCEQHRDCAESSQVQLHDGRWLNINYRRMDDGGTVSIRTEITEHKRREAALLHLSEEVATQNLRFNTALENMVQGLCLFDAEQRLIVCNRRYLQMYGFSPDVVRPGIKLREIMEYSVSLGNYSAEDAQRAVSERPTHARLREHAVLHQRLRDGRVIAVMHQPMAEGGSVATYEDVTQIVRAEDELREYAAKLERSNRELQDFASIASHDLQEPLRKIEAFGDRLKAKYNDQLGDQGQMYLGRMQDAASRMRLLINDLLGYSRVTSRAKPFEPVDLQRIVEEVTSDLQIALEQSGGRVEASDLPRIDADPTQLRQLLQNLISNALKFHKPDTAPVVTIGAVIAREEAAGPDEREVCELRVADNGIGFERKYADRIFGIFQRLHGRNEYEGTGIGLATCRKIVDRHGGTITAIGEPGKGATFVCRLPVKQSNPEESNE